MNIKKLIQEEIEEFDLKHLFEEDEFDPFGHIEKPQETQKLEVNEKEDCVLGMSKNNAKLDWPFFSLPAGYTCPFAKGCKTFPAKWKGTAKKGEWVKPDSWEQNYKMGPEAEYLCYAGRAQAQYPSANISAFNNLNLLKKLKTSEEMADLIVRSLKYHGFDKSDLFRVHEAGDFFSQTYFDAWMETARRVPGTLFYAYTVSLPFWIARKGSIPRNFKLIASWDDSNKDVIEREGLRHARVVSGEDEARQLGLRIDVDDMLAWGTDDSFALPLHGSQPKGTEAAEIRKQQKKKGEEGLSFDDKIKSGKKRNQSYKDELRAQIRQTLRNESYDLYGRNFIIKEDNQWGGTGRDLEMRGHRGYDKNVYVHRNLNAPPYFSIKQAGGATGGKVIGYDTSIHLKDVKFIVGEKGNREVLPVELGGEGKAKNVHAGAVGKHVSSGQNYDVEGWTLVRYNPRDGHKNFIIAETGEPIFSAKEAILMNEKEVWVKL